MIAGAQLSANQNPLSQLWEDDFREESQRVK